MVVVVIKTHHNHGLALVFSVHCMAIYVIRNFTGRSPIISFKQTLLSFDWQLHHVVLFRTEKLLIKLGPRS